MDRRKPGSHDTAFTHLRRALTRAFRRVLLTGFIFAILGAAATEGVAVLLTGALPTIPTHVAAVAVGLLLGYALAATVAFRALLGAIVEAMEWVVERIENLAARVVQDAESVLRLPGGAAARSEPVTATRTGRNTSGASGLSSGTLRGVEDER